MDSKFGAHTGRNDLIRQIVKEWLETNGYLPVHMLEEGDEADGRA